MPYKEFFKGNISVNSLKHMSLSQREEAEHEYAARIRDDRMWKEFVSVEDPTSGLQLAKRIGVAGVFHLRDVVPASFTAREGILHKAPVQFLQNGKNDKHTTNLAIFIARLPLEEIATITNPTQLEAFKDTLTHYGASPSDIEAVRRGERRVTQILLNPLREYNAHFKREKAIFDNDQVQVQLTKAAISLKAEHILWEDQTC